jgi:hypothetical protein
MTDHGLAFEAKRNSYMANSTYFNILPGGCCDIIILIAHAQWRTYYYVTDNFYEKLEHTFI